jgi:hypothetical protein
MTGRVLSALSEPNLSQYGWQASKSTLMLTLLRSLWLSFDSESSFNCHVDELPLAYQSPFLGVSSLDLGRSLLGGFFFCRPG